MVAASLIVNSSFASDTLDCNSQSYHVSVSVGSDNYFSEIYVYSKKTTNKITLKKEILFDASLNWETKSICLSTGTQNEFGTFNMCANKKCGLIIIDGIQEKIECDWER